MGDRPGHKTQTVAIIPARGGSKGIKEKNIAPLNGRPLVSYTIEAALRARLIDRVIVSTDSPKIAEVAEHFGAEVPFLRPEALGGDWVPLPEVLEHAVRFLEEEQGISCDPIVTLLPTNPLREARHIDEALELFFREDADALNSMHPVEEAPDDLFFHDPSTDHFDLSFPFRGDKEDQGNDQLYVANGAVNIASRERLRLVYQKRFEELSQRKVVGYVMSPLAGMDINLPDDLQRAEAVIRYLQGKEANEDAT